jgi:protoheme IX farnesyltransferase
MIRAARSPDVRRVAAIVSVTDVPATGVTHGPAEPDTSADDEPAGPAAGSAAVVTVTRALPVAQGRRARAKAVAARVGAYVALTKPRIVELLLVTTVPAMVMAAGRVPNLGLVAAVLVGGSLAAGAANALNCYLDRDIDVVMRRTSRRPLPAHRVEPRSALWFGLVLAVVSLVVMAVFTNALATALTAASIAYYDLVYTLWLKRRTSQSTFWGGVCGAAPVLIGWAAVTGSLSAAAVVLFGVVFWWQLPHFYALAIKFKDDYARAGVPMLPVVASLRRVGVESVVFAWLTVATSLLMVPLGLGWTYALAALVAGAGFVWEAHRMERRIRRGDAPRPMQLFHWSTSYLTIVFVAVAVSVLLGF